MTRATRLLRFIPVVITLLIVAACTYLPETGSSRSTEPVALSPDADAIFITIDSVGVIWIDGQIADLQTTESQLDRLQSVNQDRPLVISAETSAPNTTLIAVLDAARTTGIANISIVATN